MATDDLDASVFSDLVKKEIQNAAKGGVSSLRHYITDENNRWKQLPLNIGIIGESGVGKSSYINAIRGLKAGDPGAAHVDVVEATRGVKTYDHPCNTNFIFSDLPGVGTPNFPRDTYLDAVKFDSFDFFLILSAERFKESDLWLAQEIRKSKKNFYFVRTKMYIEIENDKKCHLSTHDENAVVEKVRKNCKEYLAEKEFADVRVFLIDNYAPNKLDFDSLMVQLIDDAPALKKEAMVLSMSVLSDGVIDKKVEVLRGRIYRIALISAAAGAVPIPGVDAGVDAALLTEEIDFYKMQLGIDPNSMQEIAVLLKIDTNMLKEFLNLSLLSVSKNMTSILTASLASDIVEMALPVVIPVVGSIISAGVSYGTSVVTLRLLLNQLASDAKKINNALIKHI